MKDKFEKSFSLLSESIRHDIANQVSAILAYADLIKEEIMEGNDGQAEALRFLDAIVSASENISRQMDFLKKYGSDGYNYWQSLIKIYNQCILPEGIEITFEEGIDRMYIYANSLIPKVFENLVNNTLLHGEGATKISISYEVLEDGDLVIIYKDDGVGIPRENKELVFKKGFGKNTGLGLFLIKSILDITDMQISETGQYGKGVEFRIRVPQGSYIIQ